MYVYDTGKSYYISNHKILDMTVMAPLLSNGDLIQKQQTLFCGELISA
jgi:hypothetical protein